MRPLYTLIPAALLLAGCSATLTPSEHHAEIDTIVGHPVADWAAYRDHARKRCRLGRQEFADALTREATRATWPAIQTDVRALCPRRAQEVDDWYRVHGPL